MDSLEANFTILPATASKPPVSRAGHAGPPPPFSQMAGAKAGMVTLSQLVGFDEVIDVRSPAEFAEDHIPGAINCPVLDDEERARVGTLYKQVSAFDAKKIGAALVARNIARHIEQHFMPQPKGWKPLIYCWRGGSRSAAMAYILRQIGWNAGQLDGGYRAYRRQVITDLAILPERFTFRVVCGATGSGKSRLLQALKTVHAQVLDLEELAAHRGSVLGSLPGQPQPSQKMFDSLVCAELSRFDPAQPVFVEAESKKIGLLRVPDALIARMWVSGCIHLEMQHDARIQLLAEEYAHFLAAPHTLHAKLDLLVGLHSRERIAHWKVLADGGAWNQLVDELLTEHYDPAYRRSTLKHYSSLGQAIALSARDGSPGSMARLAAELLMYPSSPQ